METIEKNTATKPDFVPPKKAKMVFSKFLSWALGVLGLLVVLAIIGFGALLAGHVWNPSWNPFSSSPVHQKVSQK